MAKCPAAVYLPRFACKSSLTAAFDDPPICQSLGLNGVQHRWQLVIAVARVQHPRPTGDVLAVLVGEARLAPGQTFRASFVAGVLELPRVGSPGIRTLCRRSIATPVGGA